LPADFFGARDGDGSIFDAGAFDPATLPVRSNMNFLKSIPFIPLLLKWEFLVGTLRVALRETRLMAPVLLITTLASCAGTIGNCRKLKLSSGRSPFPPLVHMIINRRNTTFRQAGAKLFLLFNI
jgi:hypothetical protein